MGQLVCTRKAAEAESLLVWPVALTVWLPGRAVLGTMMFWENVTLLLVVAVPTVVVSKVMVTCSLAPKPVPLTITLEVGGPEVGESLMLAPAASAIELAVIKSVRQTTKAMSERTMFTLKPEEEYIMEPHFQRVLYRDLLHSILIETRHSA